MRGDVLDALPAQPDLALLRLETLDVLRARPCRHGRLLALPLRPRPAGPLRIARLSLKAPAPGGPAGSHESVNNITPILLDRESLDHGDLDRTLLAILVRLSRSVAT